MAIFYPPPPPFMGGRQPYEPRKLTPADGTLVADDPPFDPRADALAASVDLAWRQPVENPRQRRPVLVVSAEEPPFGERRFAVSVTLRSAWNPPDPFASQPRYNLVISAEEPPFSSRRALVDTVRAWEPGEPPRQPIRRLVVSAEEPPFDRRYDSLLASIDAAWRLPGENPRQRGPAIVVSAEEPPFDARRQTLLQNLWRPIDDPPPQYRTRIAPLIEVATVPDAVPGGQPKWLFRVLDSWQPDATPAWHGRWIVQDGTVVANNPPFGMRAVALRDRSWWEIPDYQVIQLHHVAAAVSGLQSSSYLFFAVTSAAKYRFRFIVWAHMTGAGDFEYDLSGPAVTFLRYSSRRIDQGGSTLSATAIRTAFGTKETLTGAGVGEALVEVVGYIQPSASGTVAFRWMKNAGTTVRQGSVVEWHKIS